MLFHQLWLRIFGKLKSVMEQSVAHKNLDLPTGVTVVALVVGWVLLYVHRNRRLIRDGSRPRTAASTFTQFLPALTVVFQVFPSYQRLHILMMNRSRTGHATFSCRRRYRILGIFLESEFKTVHNVVFGQFVNVSISDAVRVYIYSSQKSTVGSSNAHRHIQSELCQMWSVVAQ